jgi:F-type H+-transporting ATPase subunit b
MGNFLLLAAEGHTAAAEHGGFGFNFDILEANLINLAILIGILFYFGRGVISNIITERRTRIETAITEAEQRSKQAADALADAQQNLTQAQAEAQRILKAAEASAQAAREAILAKAAQDIETLKKSASDDLSAAQEKAIAELRQRIAVLAIQEVEAQLVAQLDDSTQSKLVDRSIALLGVS